MPPPPIGLILPYVDPTTVVVPPANTASLVIDLMGRLSVIKPDGSITIPINVVGTAALSNSTGNQTITPTAPIFTASVAITGTATVRQFYLSNVGLTSSNAGNRVRMIFNMAGQVAGIGLQVYDSNSSGALLFNFTTDGTQPSAFADFYFDGGNWKIDLQKIPAIS